MINNKYIIPFLFFSQLYASEDNLLMSDQLDDGIPLEYEPIFSISELETELQDSKDSQTDSNMPSTIQMSTLEGGSIYQFTNCNTTGASGPTQDKINIEYSGTNYDPNTPIIIEGYFLQEGDDGSSGTGKQPGG